MQACAEPDGSTCYAEHAARLQLHPAAHCTQHGLKLQQTIALTQLLCCTAAQAAAMVPASLQGSLQRLRAPPSEETCADVASWGPSLAVGLAVAMADLVLQVEVSC